MPFNPSLPADASLVDAGELRNQFNGLQNNIQAKANEDECVNRFSLCAPKPTPIDGLGMVASPTYAPEQTQQLADKVDEILAFLKGA